MERIKPNLFIVGFPKAGTTSLHMYLNQHPDIFMAEEKETWHFGRDLYEESCGFNKKPSVKFRYIKEKDYLKLFIKAKKEKVIGESTPAYIYSKTAAQEIYEFNNNSKIILIIREPVDFLYSLHSQYVLSAVEDIVDFKQALEAEKLRQNGHNIPSSVVVPSRLFYTERVKYYDQIKRFMDYFPEDKLKILIFEDFINDIEQAYRDILVFLGVDDIFRPDFRIYNPNEVPRNYKLIKIVLLSNIKSVIQNITPLPVYNKFKSLSKKILFRKVKRELLNPALRKDLMHQFKIEIQKTSDLLKIDLVEKWGYDQI